jgi:hypothetical protein
MAVAGMTNREIAQALFLPTTTVEGQLSQAYSRLVSAPALVFPRRLNRQTRGCRRDNLRVASDARSGPAHHPQLEVSMARSKLVVVDITQTLDTVSGRVTVGDGAATGFFGWLELIDRLQSAAATSTNEARMELVDRADHLRRSLR